MQTRTATKKDLNCHYCGGFIAKGEKYYAVHKGKRYGSKEAVYDTKNCITLHANEDFVKAHNARVDKRTTMWIEKDKIVKELKARR